jgi:trimeric autotransporter adhesin
MSSTKHKLRLVGAFAALAMLALAVSCTGFFQNPTLSTITIDPPTPTISQGATQQMTATGTFQDGTTSTLTGGTSCSGSTVCWSSSDTTVVTITTSGSATGVAQGTATITAASGAITGTTQATVDLTNVTNYQICQGTFGSTDCSSGSSPLTSNITAGTQQTFIAQGSSNGQIFDLTVASTWTMTSAAPANGSIECTNDGVSSPETCVVQDGTTPNTYTFSVTYGSTTILTATLNIVVAP